MTVSDLAPDPTTFDGMIAWCREQRRHGPVRYNEHQNGWELFDHADVGRVLFDPVTFSSDFSGLAPSQEDFDLFVKGDITGVDPPRHRKLRGLVSQALTPRMIADLAPRIRIRTDALLDEVGDEFDLVDALADPLPIMVIAELLGIPVADWPLLRGWATVMLGSDDVRDDTTNEDIARALAELAPTVRELNAYLAAHVQHCRAHPGDDLTSRLVAAEVDGQRLADDEILGFVGSLLSAGHITMTALLTSAIVLLDQHPDAAAELRADPTKRPAAFEEVLRCRPPFPQIGRRTTGAVEIAGTSIPADSMITLWVAAANRDGTRFADPDTFDIHRRPNPHLAFGHGIHFCVGAPLARLEAAIVLDVLFGRYTDIAVAPAPEFRNPWLMTTAKRLPVAVRPGPRRPPGDH
ncbi:MAG TPA: cytochrome P450 [Pseudonocardiaceae bacterium]|nr:cytochrome P450 [Pseudonocardiaceae bacterium]